MSVPALDAAIRSGCNLYANCSTSICKYPDCGCKFLPKVFLAVIRSLKVPTPERRAAVRDAIEKAEGKPAGAVDYDRIADAAIKADWAHILGEAK